LIVGLLAALGASGGPLPVPGYLPHDATTIKFTSGSTGEPKGLAATVGSIDSSISAVQALFRHGDGDSLFVFLPLSLLQQRYWIYSALRFGHDVTVSTYEAAFPALRQAGATVVMGVPAFYETARNHVEARARRMAGGAVPAPAHLRDAARELFGGRIRYLWTGSAAARPATLAFFADAGLPIYEGYGLNETCIVAKNHPQAHRPGSVGQVLPGKKVTFDASGRISVHSEHPVNWRYEHAAPGESERVFAPDGTVRTGDLGYLDEDGFLFILGRADDVVVLDNGRNILVRPLEEFLKESPAIGECVVACPGQSRLVAVISPAGDPPDTAAIAAQVAAAGAAFGAELRIGDIVIAPEPFSVGNGMLTSQFKPRRRRIAEAYLAPAAEKGARHGS
jgi:long-subunit acyl-CoA synthetase (AMP-forming)